MKLRHYAKRRMAVYVKRYAFDWFCDRLIRSLDEKIECGVDAEIVRMVDEEFWNLI